MKKYSEIMFLCCVTAALMAAAAPCLRDQDNRKESEGDLYRCNLELCREKGLLEEGMPNRRYLRLRDVYRANMEAYLLDVLDIKALDDEMKGSGLGFTGHSREDCNLYEREYSMGLEFIYLRNHLYIEYLSKEQLRLLERQAEKGGIRVSEEVKDMVKSTYRDVIRVRDPRDWEDESRFLYPAAQGRKPVIPNQAVVLGIADAMEYDAAGRLLADEHREEKYAYLDAVKEEKEEEYAEILGTEVYILVE